MSMIIQRVPNIAVCLDKEVAHLKHMLDVGPSDHVVYVIEHST